MKNVLLIGDSIRMGYDEAVKTALEGKANVLFPEENCQFIYYVFRYFHEWLDRLGVRGEDVDVVHWNAGLHDCLRMFGEEPNTPLEIYGYYVERTCARIKKICPNAKVIFATCTRVDEQKMNPNFMRCNSDIEEYNAVAVKAAKKHGFYVNDLYSLSVSLPDEAMSDMFHYYTDIGTRAFSKQVLSCVTEALGIK